MKTNLEAKTLAHDLRSPLTALKLTTLDLATCEDTRKVIEESLKTLEKLVQRVALLQTTKPSFSRGVSRPYLIAQKVIKTAKLRYASCPDLTISASLDSSAAQLDATICELEFERALTNLINNSVEALCGEGLVRIELKVKRKTIQLSVIDSGPGIPHHLLASITAPGVTYGKKQGTGLGLYQAKQAVENSGGRLLISSKEGHGTQIILEIPFLSPSQTDELPAMNVVKLVSHLSLRHSA